MEATMPARRAPLPWRRVARIALEVLLVLVILLLAFVAYGTINNRWYHTVIISGGSMSPTINLGDAIIITRPPAQLQPGMIVTMESKGSAVTHRVVELRADGVLVTKGDANEAAEEWQPGQGTVVGVVRLRVPYIGYAWIVAQNVRALFQPNPLQVEWTPAKP